MSILLEHLILGGATAVNSALVLVAKRLYKNRPVKKFVCPFGSIAWRSCYIYQTGKFGCPKCGHQLTNVNQPKICDCLDYPNLHFHFKCKLCEYTTILRTADDNPI